MATPGHASRTRASNTDGARVAELEAFGALPVVDDQDRLMGIVSYVDLLRYLGARLGEDAVRRPEPRPERRAQAR